MSLDTNSILLLKNLFRKCNNDGSESSEGEDENVPGKSSHFPKKSEIKKTLENPLMKKIDGNESGNSKIQSLEEFEEAIEKETELIENLKVPEYSVVFQQSVAPEDVYLQISGKLPSISCSDDMIMKIDLPDESAGIDGMNLVVEENFIKLRTKIYHLHAPLTQKIDKRRSKAAFDAESKQLILTLKLNRDI